MGRISAYEIHMLTEALGVGHVQCTSGQCRHYDKWWHRVDPDGLSRSAAEGIR
jgi:hypothetical protein